MTVHTANSEVHLVVVFIRYWWKKLSKGTWTLHTSWCLHISEGASKNISIFLIYALWCSKCPFEQKTWDIFFCISMPSQQWCEFHQFNEMMVWCPFDLQIMIDCAHTYFFHRKEFAVVCFFLLYINSLERKKSIKFKLSVKMHILALLPLKCCYLF